MPIEDAIRWNKRYDTAPSYWFASPRSFLVENLDLLPRQGLALDLAMGPGQNASLLVSHGLRVIGLDISTSAVKGARFRTPEIMAAVVDLTNFYLPTHHFDVVVNFYYLQRSLFPDFSRILKPGGWLVFETLTVEMLSDQPDINPANLLEMGELRERFSDWDIQVYHEGWMTSDHGNRKSVASLIARSRLTRDGTMQGESNMGALDQLKKAVIHQKTNNLPETPQDPGFSILHSRIMDYDRYVTETVIGVMGGSHKAKEYSGASEIETEIEQLAGTAAGPDRTVINYYRDYKNRLDQMLALAIEATKETL